MKAGDEVPEATQGSGDHICPICNGTGRAGRQHTTEICPMCEGTGTIARAIGG